MRLPVVILAEAILVALTLRAISSHNRRLEWLAKPAASLIFVVVGVTRWAQGSSFDSLMVLGLGLGLVGDVLLIDKRTFRPGLLAFLAGHCATVAAFAQALPWTSWPRWLLIPLCLFALLIARWLSPHTGRLRAPVTAYVIVVSVLMWGGISASAARALPITAGAGAVLFAVSDLAVARHRFIDEHLLNRALGLPLYFAAQLMLAWTVGSL